MNIKHSILLLLTIFLGTIIYANKNPLLPGYFADPTIQKFDGVYYIYSTSDGIKLASGQPTVWISYDFENWYNQELDIELPEGLTNCWAPDVVKGADNKYYYYMGNCQFGCNIYGYVSDNPIGPWKPINNGNPVIPVGTGNDNLPALDAQFLIDDDGSVYSYFGTWCTSFDGVGWAKINSENMYTIEDEGYIPIEQLPHAFEAAYPIKINDKYILMYSSGDCRLSSYAVHYAYSNSPTGPFTYGKNNPILETNTDRTIDGPGHHSILKEDDKYYILYHRHDNPHSTGGEFRQVCADKVVFINDSTIQKIIPTHENNHFRNKTTHTNMALNASAEASSYYHLVSKATRYTRDDVNFEYLPQYATDNNNGTLWKAGSNKLPQSLLIDLGKKQNIKRIMTNFEYSTLYYQYKIEVSENKQQWQLYADQTTNRTAGAPMIDDNDANCRYIKITVTGTEKTGMYAAIWNVKAYNTLFNVPPIHNTKVNNESGALSSNRLLIFFDANDLKYGMLKEKVSNKGAINENFEVKGNLTVTEKDKRKAVQFKGDGYLELDQNAPSSLDWNSSFTVAAWVYVDEVPDGKCIMAWNSRKNMLQSSYAALMYGRSNYGAMAHGDGAVDLPFKNIPQAGKWQHIAVTFDGMLETVYVNGKLDTQMPLMLFVTSDKIRIGASGMPTENFTGYISETRLYDYALTPNEIKKLAVFN